MSEEPFLPPELLVIAGQIKRSETPPKITVRQLLNYFGYHRRGFMKVSIIQEALDALGIATVPEFTDVWIDAEIDFVSRASKERVGGTASERTTDEPDITGVQPTDDSLNLFATESFDPTFRIGILPAANQPIVSVNPDDEITAAKALSLCVRGHKML